MARPEASVSRTKGFEKLGKAKVGAWVMAVLRVRSACEASSFQWNASLRIRE
ncbi:hypothetical protein A2U01_0055887, partial [Trifolium medium]|nr:hypothetical protein [Trifolium medium]